MITIEIVDGTKITSAFLDAWKTILPNERWSVFLHPGWFNAARETLFKHADIKIIVASLENDIVGIMPITNFQMNKYGLYLKVAEIMPGRAADYWCPIIKPGYEATVFPEMVKAAMELPMLSKTFIWPHLPETSDYLLSLRSYLQKESLDYIEYKSRCPWLPMEQDYASMEKKWGKKHATHLRQSRNKLIKDHGSLELYVIDSQTEAREHLPIFFEMHNKKWISQNSPAVFANPILKELFNKFIDYLWEDGVHFSALKCGNKIISYHFGFFSNGFLLYYKPTYDIDFHNYSPGKLHISFLIEEGIKQGWKGFDFLQGEEPYKYHWTKNAITTSTFVVKTRKYSPTYYWLTKGRPFVEQKIGKLYLRILAFSHKLKLGSKQ